MPRPRLTRTPYYRSDWLISFLLCIVLATTPACAQCVGKNYFPIADGAKWEYTGRFSSASGKEFNIRATARVDGETLINGRRYFKFMTASDLPTEVGVRSLTEDVRYYRLAEDGIYFRLSNTTDKPDLLEIPLPIPVGVKWLSGTTEAQAERAGTIRVRGRNYTDCLKITFKVAGGTRTTENYYAPNVGIIKTVYVNPTGPRSVVELTLEKYEQ